jgi:hypothetical protein
MALICQEFWRPRWIRNELRYDPIGSAPVDEVRARLRDAGRGTFDWGV